MTELEKSMKIKELKQERLYKYLGVNESNRIQHVTMKEKIRKNATEEYGPSFKQD